MTSRLVTVLAIMLAVAALAGASIRLLNTSSHSSPPAHASLPPTLASYLGVFEPGAPPSYDPIADFAVNQAWRCRRIRSPHEPRQFSWH